MNEEPKFTLEIEYGKLDFYFDWIVTQHPISGRGPDDEPGEVEIDGLITIKFTRKNDKTTEETMLGESWCHMLIGKPFTDAIGVAEDHFWSHVYDPSSAWDDEDY